MSKKWANSLKLLFVLLIALIGTAQLQSVVPPSEDGLSPLPPAGSSPAANSLASLSIRGRAPKTGYSRTLFSSGWGNISSCDARNYVLARDLYDITYVPNSCRVQSGLLADPYTGRIIKFTRGQDTSDDVQIDHVVSLSDAWQKGAQSLSPSERLSLANDPLNLLAVEGDINQQKGDSDAASWLPPNKAYRCPYVARQIAVKLKYQLWVTKAEYSAMAKVLSECPAQNVPSS